MKTFDRLTGRAVWPKHAAMDTPKKHPISRCALLNDAHFNFSSPRWLPIVQSLKRRCSAGGRMTFMPKTLLQEPRRQIFGAGLMASWWVCHFLRPAGSGIRVCGWGQGRQSFYVSHLHRKMGIAQAMSRRYWQKKATGPMMVRRMCILQRAAIAGRRRRLYEKTCTKAGFFQLGIAIRPF